MGTKGRDQISKVRIRVRAKEYSNLNTPNARIKISLNHIIAYDSEKQGFDGELVTFPVFQQGMGRIDPIDAILSDYQGEMNGGMQPGNAYYGPVVYDFERSGYMLVDEHRNPLPENEDFFWDGDWLYSGGWLYSGSYARAGG